MRKPLHQALQEQFRQIHEALVLMTTREAIPVLTEMHDRAYKSGFRVGSFVGAIVGSATTSLLLIIGAP